MLGINTLIYTGADQTIEKLRAKFAEIAFSEFKLLHVWGSDLLDGPSVNAKVDEVNAVLAAVVATVVLGSGMKLKVPTPERLAKEPLKVLAGKTEIWLESQRPALPAPAERVYAIRPGALRYAGMPFAQALAVPPSLRVLATAATGRGGRVALWRRRARRRDGCRTS